MTRILALLLACGALVTLGACGDDDGDNTNTTAPAATATTDTGTTGTTETGGAGEEVEIEIKDFAYSPKDATVEVGQTVKWRAGGHRAARRRLPERARRSRRPFMQKGGDPRVHRQGGSGKVEYICSIHPQMEGDSERSLE